MRDTNERPTLEDVVYEFLEQNESEDLKAMLKDMLYAYIGSDMAEMSSGLHNAGVLHLYFQLCEFFDDLESHRDWLIPKKHRERKLI